MMTPVSDDDLVYADSSDDDVKKGNANKQRRNKSSKPIVSFDQETARGLSELDVFNPKLNLGGSKLLCRTAGQQ
jgi:hypothetical protein